MISKEYVSYSNNLNVQYFKKCYENELKIRNNKYKTTNKNMYYLKMTVVPDKDTYIKLCKWSSTIDGLTVKRLFKLMESGLVKDYEDLFYLELNELQNIFYDNSIKSDKMKQYKSDVFPVDIYATIQERDIDVYHLFLGLGVNIGRQESFDIYDECKTPNNIYEKYLNHILPQNDFNQLLNEIRIVRQKERFLETFQGKKADRKIYNKQFCNRIN